MTELFLDHCYYCYVNNLFTPDPHDDTCCIECYVKLPRIYYKLECWFPLTNVRTNGPEPPDVQYTLDGEHYIKWYPTIKETT